MKQNETNHYLKAFSTHDIPVTVLIENAKRLDAVPEEERDALREVLAREIEDKYPYMPGEDPALPGLPIAEAVFTYPAYSNIRNASRRFNNKKDEIKTFELHTYLNIGNIREEIDSRYRIALARRMSIGYCHDDEYDEDTYTKDNNRLNKYWSYLKTFLDEGKHLRIWYSNHPEELCGFYWLCSHLKKYDQEFYAVELPDVAKHEGKTEKVYSWSQMSVENIMKAVENARLLSKEEIIANAEVWGRLKKENAPLRVVVNGQLISVPEEFYDPWILSCIPADEPIKIQDVHRRFCDCQKTAEAGWLIHRIDKLIGEGKIELVKQHEYVWEELIRLKK